MVNLYLLSPATWRSRGNAGRGMQFLTATLSLAALLAASEAQAQTVSDTRNPPQATTASQPAQLTPSVAAVTEISAPEPAPNEASVAKPAAVPFLSIEATQNNGQSSSQDSNQTSQATTKTTSAKTKPPHRALGVTLAVIGTTALVAGVVLYAGEKAISVCNGSSSGCNEAKDTGIALMPIGAGVAVMGFYLQFHR